MAAAVMRVDRLYASNGDSDSMLVAFNSFIFTRKLALTASAHRTCWANDSAQRRRVYKMHLIRYFPHFVSLFIYFIHKDSFFQVYSDSAPGKKRLMRITL